MLAFGAALAYWLRTMPDLRFNPSDTHHYDQMAVSLLTHGTLGTDTTASPGYSVFLAGVYAVFGHSNLIAASLVNLGLFGLLAAMVGWAGSRLFGVVPGYLAAIGVALNPTLLYFAHFVGSEPLFLVLFFLLAVVLIAFRETGTRRLFIAAVVVAAAAAFTRAAFLLALPAVLLCLMTAPTRRGLRAPAVFLLAFLALLAPWSYRSSRVAGRPVLITDQGGNEFAASTNARYAAYLKRALLKRGYPPGPPAVASYPPAEFETAEPRFPDGFAFVIARPFGWLQLYALKLYYHLQFFNLTNIRSLTLSAYGGAYYAVVWTLVAMFLVRGQRGNAGLVFGSLIAANVLIHPLLNIEPYFRFRVPIEPFILMLAAGGLATFDYFSTRKSPMARTSSPVEKNVRSASSGVRTTG